MSMLAKDADWRNRGQGPAETGKPKFRGANDALGDRCWLWGLETCLTVGDWRFLFSSCKQLGGGGTSVTSTHVQGWGGREVGHWGEET